MLKTADERSTAIKFTSNTSGLKQGVGEVIAQLNQLNKALVDNQYKQKDCNKTISDAKKELQNIKKDIKENGSATADQEKKMEELNRTIEEEKLKLSQLRTEQASLRQAISETSKEVTTQNQEWSVLKETIAHLSAEALQALISKLVEVGKAVIQIGEQFSASMSEVAAISGASEEDLARLEQTAREYGATTKFSASESAQALKYMALAGWDANQSIEALGSVLDLAAAGGMDLARASDIVTDYITAFGLSVDDAAHFTDIMAYAMSNSNTNVEQLGEAYKSCAANAGSMGYSVEDVTAALMTMANAGIKGGQAGTSLNAIMTRLATDTKGCATELEKYGVKIYDEQGNMKSLSSILGSMAGMWDTLTDKEQANLGKMIAGQNQIVGFQTIMSGLSEKAKEAGSSFSDYTEALEKCDGASTDMAKTMSNNLSGDLKTMQSAFEELALKIYEDGEGPLRSLVQTITNQGVPALESLIEHLDILVPIVVAAGTAFITYKAAMGMQSVLMGVVAGIKSLTKATEEAAAAQGTLNAVQAANPIGLVLAAVGALTAGLITYSAMAQNSANATNNLNKSTTDYLSGIENAKKNTQERLEQADSEAQTLAKLKDRYDELRTAVSLTEDEKKQLDSIATELSKTLNVSIEDLKDESGAYKDLTKDIDDYISKLKEQIRFEGTKDQLVEAQKSYTKALEAIKKTQKEITETNEKAQKEAEESIKKFGYVIPFNSYTGNLNKLEDKLHDAQTQAAVAATNIYNFSKELGSGEKALEEYEKNLEALNGEEEDFAEEIDNSYKKKSVAVHKTIELNDVTKDLTEKITNLNKAMESSDKVISSYLSNCKSLHSAMSELASIHNDLANGQKLDLNALLSLAEKYPEYSDMLLGAAGNADKQRKAVNLLFEAKKNEYIISQQAAIDEITASNKTAQTEIDNIETRIKGLKEYAKGMKKYLDPVLKLMGLSPLDTEAIPTDWAKTLSNLKKRIDTGNNEIKGFEKNIEFIRNLKIGDLKSNTTSTSGSGGSGSGGSTEEKKVTVEGSGITATGSSEFEARLKWMDKMVELERADEKQQIKWLEQWKKNFYLTSDEEYEAEKRLHNLRKKVAEDEAKDKEKAETERKRVADEKERARAKEVSDYLADINYKKSLDQISTKEEINLYDEALKKFKLTEDEKKDIIKRRYDAQKSLPTGEYTYTLDSLGVKGSGNTAAAAALEWLDRAVSLGKLSEERQLRHLEHWLKSLELSEDEYYEMSKRIYSLRENLQKKASEEEAKTRKENLDLAKAAFEAETNKKIECLKKESDAIKKTADDEIAKIDAVMKKRNEDNDDKKRQDELDLINAQLKYKKLDKLSRRELERRKQDILNEQYEVDFTREQEKKKEDIRTNASAAQENLSQKISGLQENLSSFTDRLALILGSQTASQKVVNNSTKQNIQIVQNALSGDQIIDKIIKALYSG